MTPLRPGFDLADFFRTAARTRRRALILDYDGTLAPFSEDRDHAVPYPGVRDALERIDRGGDTRLTIVSGRSLGDLERLVASLPRTELWGSHGLEHRDRTGATHSTAASPETSRFRDDASRWIEGQGWGSLLERKPFGLALHSRGAPEADDTRARSATIARWGAAAGRGGLELLEFVGGFEWRPAGRHKGEVVRAILAEAEGASIAYLGDDWTDEDAFESLAGKGLAVLVREELRATRADLWIRPPGELLEFLAGWAERR